MKASDKCYFLFLDISTIAPAQISVVGGKRFLFGGFDSCIIEEENTINHITVIVDNSNTPE